MPSHPDETGPSRFARPTAAEEERAAAEARAERALTLFSAVARLHECNAREDVLAAIGDIAAGCVRVPASAVYLREGDRLLPAHVAGRPSARPRRTLLGAGLVGRATAERRILVGPATGAGGRDVAVPLGAAGPPGAIVLFALQLPNGQLSPDLRQALDIVAHHAAIALARTAR